MQTEAPGRSTPLDAYSIGRSGMEPDRSAGELLAPAIEQEPDYIARFHEPTADLHRRFVTDRGHPRHSGHGRSGRRNGMGLHCRHDRGGASADDVGPMVRADGGAGAVAGGRHRFERLPCDWAGAVAPGADPGPGRGVVRFDGMGIGRGINTADQIDASIRSSGRPSDVASGG